MTQVYFYTLPSEATAARLHFVCRLTEKACSLGHKIHIHAESSQQAKVLDDLLWQYRPASFIPHRIIGSDPDNGEAVSVSSENLAGSHGDMLVNLAAQACQTHDQYARINEVISADDESLEQGRKHYRFYKEKGCSLKTFTL